MKTEHNEDIAARAAATLFAANVHPNVLAEMAIGLRSAQAVAHHLADRSGWWTDIDTGEKRHVDDVNIPEKICLMHSELSEAMEACRKNRNDDHLPHRAGLEVELADAVIRILDLAGFLKLDLTGAIIEKLAYNQNRADHSLAARQKADGKKF